MVIPFVAVGAMSTACASAQSSGAAGSTPPTTSVPGVGASSTAQPVANGVVATLPGLGPQTLAKIPASAGQVLIATGKSKTSWDSTLQLFTKVSGGWQPDGSAWSGHNGYHGWTDKHYLNDDKSPIGVYGLTDAGGLLPNPGTKLRYTQSTAFTDNGIGVLGEPLAGVFDYVIAINYNRKPGTSPLDPTKPMGAARGGGVWLHVDPGGPTLACVNMSRDAMKKLLLTLDPALNPVVVMGDAASLAR